jgi:hypothetical protein
MWKTFYFYTPNLFTFQRILFALRISIVAMQFKASIHLSLNSSFLGTEFVEIQTKENNISIIVKYLRQYFIY